MKATDLLKQHHREVEDVFRQLEAAEDDEERGSLREELANMLAAHTAIEEEIFYPAAMEAIGQTSRVREALEEHAVCDFALYRLLSVSPSDETFTAKVGTLKDVVMNHVEEEESELLPQAEGEMDKDKLEALGERLAARFEERLALGYKPILERSLGLAARHSAEAAPGAKGAKGTKQAKGTKRSPRAQAKRAAPQKRARPAAKQAAAPATQKRNSRAAAPAAQKQNGGTAARSQSRKAGAGAQKTSAARGQGVSRKAGGAATRGQTGAATRGQTGAQGAQKTTRRAPARKQRAGR